MKDKRRNKGLGLLGKARRGIALWGYRLRRFWAGNAQIGENLERFVKIYFAVVAGYDIVAFVNTEARLIEVGSK